MKKIISFGLWGDDPKYTTGAVKNMELLPVVYPGWTARFYVASDLDKSLIKRLKSMGAEVVVMRQDQSYKAKRYWRLLVMFDGDIKRFIIRDTDSRLNKRGAWAVNEWVKSGKDGHCMRDHPHHSAQIMGGMWGFKGGILKVFEVAYDRWVNNVAQGIRPKRMLGKPLGDQTFLRDVIWKEYKDRFLVHDDRKRKTGKERPFKVGLGKNNFVGQVFTPDGKPVYKGHHT